MSDKVKFYERNGRRVNEKTVLRARDAYVKAKRTGNMGVLKCSIQLEVSKSVQRMSAREFASFSVMYTYRVIPS